MKFSIVLNELQAEIINKKIPYNKIFIQGNIPKSIPSEWRSVLEKIMKKLQSLKLLYKFKADKNPLDIEGIKPSGTITLIADTGEKYFYDVERDLLYDENKKKLG